MTSTCIEWPRYRDKGGYGRRRHAGVPGVLAHRVAYIEAHGLTLDDIAGREVMHSCDNPPCINPEHLSLGTHKENMEEMGQRGRVYKGGHPVKFSDATLSKVRELRRQGLTQATVARMVGMSPAYVSCLERGVNRRSRN